MSFSFNSLSLSLFGPFPCFNLSLPVWPRHPVVWKLAHPGPAPKAVRLAPWVMGIVCSYWSLTGPYCALAGCQEHKANQPATLSHSPNEEVPPLAPNTALKCQRGGRRCDSATMCIRAEVFFLGVWICVGLLLYLRVVCNSLMHQHCTHLGPNPSGFGTHTDMTSAHIYTCLNWIHRFSGNLSPLSWWLSGLSQSHIQTIGGRIQKLLMCRQINTDKELHMHVFAFTAITEQEWLGRGVPYWCLWPTMSV